VAIVASCLLEKLAGEVPGYPEQLPKVVHFVRHFEEDEEQEDGRECRVLQRPPRWGIDERGG
jgi:hypothetical protein